MATPGNKDVESAQIAVPAHSAVVEMPRLTELGQTTTALSKRMEKLAWIVTILTGVLLILTALLAYDEFFEAASS